MELSSTDFHAIKAAASELGKGRSTELHCSLLGTKHAHRFVSRCETIRTVVRVGREHLSSVLQIARSRWELLESSFPLDLDVRSEHTRQRRVERCLCHSGRPVSQRHSWEKQCQIDGGDSIIVSCGNAFSLLDEIILVGLYVHSEATWR